MKLVHIGGLIAINPAKILRMRAYYWDVTPKIEITMEDGKTHEMQGEVGTSKEKFLDHTMGRFNAALMGQ